jgi:hypothetical protein
MVRYVGLKPVLSGGFDLARKLVLGLSGVIRRNIVEGRQVKDFEKE